MMMISLFILIMSIRELKNKLRVIGDHVPRSAVQVICFS